MPRHKRGDLGYDAGKKIWGRKRHIVVDALGLIVAVVVHGGNIRDRDGVRLPLWLLRASQPFITCMFADGAYSGQDLALDVFQVNRCRLEIVKRSDQAKGFVVLPNRRVVERTFGGLIRNRRLVRGFEGLAEVSVTMVKLAMIGVMLRRLARAAWPFETDSKARPRSGPAATSR